MKIGHSSNIGTGGEVRGGPQNKGIPKNKKLSQQVIRTCSDLAEVIDKSKEIIAEDDSDLADDLENKSDELTDEIEPEEDEESTNGGEDEGNDDDIDYDEPDTGDPFDIEERGSGRRERYTVEISVKGNTPIIHFLHIPKFKTKDPLIKGAIYSRYKLFHEMAAFIGRKQIQYFQSKDEAKKVNLNQKDIVEHLNKKGIEGITTQHISRMLNALFFQIDGCVYPARYLFRRYGHKLRLNQEDAITLGREFLISLKNETGLTQVEKAKRFYEFLNNKRGFEIKLSDNPNESERFRSLIIIITQVEESLKK